MCFEPTAGVKLADSTNGSPKSVIRSLSIHTPVFTALELQSHRLKPGTYVILFCDTVISMKEFRLHEFLKLELRLPYTSRKFNVVVESREALV